MTEEYGIPVWGSYTIFAIATIIVGLILGLVSTLFTYIDYPCNQTLKLQGEMQYL